MTARPRSKVRRPQHCRSRNTAVSTAKIRMVTLATGLMFLVGCGGGSTSSGGGATTPPPTPTANSVAVAVNAGPANNAVNFGYVTVQVCNPGGTTTCATIPNVQVDTGSSGLRILASATGVSGLNLTPVTASGTPVNECFQFADGSYLWGPAEQADVSMAGENATNVPIQIIASGSAPANVPSACSSGGGNNLGSSTALQANGILGIGPAQQDCGLLCTGTTVLPYYWICPTNSACTSPAAVPTPTQVSNPVMFFGSDNNGVTLTMNSLGSPGSTSGAATGSGMLYFGVGTQTDNALSSSAKAYALSLNSQGTTSIFATYNNVTYPAWIGSAESFLFFLDPTVVSSAGISSCAQPLSLLYCSGSVVSLPFTAKDASGDSSTVTLSIGNGTTLWNSSAAVAGGSNTAFSNLAGGAALANDEVILGMPFFYGRTVYVGIAGQVPPSGVSTAFAASGYYAF